MRTASLLALFGIVKREREALVIGASGMGTFYNCRSIVDGNGATLIYIPCVKAYEANKNREDPAVQTE